MRLLPIALLLAAALPCVAEQQPNHVWTASVFAGVAGITLDMASSYGKPEANRLLRGADGRLGAKGVALNGGVLVSVVVVRLLGRRLPPKWRKVATIINFSVGASRGGVAVRNWRMR